MKYKIYNYNGASYIIHKNKLYRSFRFFETTEVKYDYTFNIVNNIDFFNYMKSRINSRLYDKVYELIIHSIYPMGFTQSHEALYVTIIMENNEIL